MDALKACLAVAIAGVLACSEPRAQEELMNFTGRERPGLMMIEAIGLTRYCPDISDSEKLIQTINFIGEGFLDVETALLTPELAAGRPRVTPELLAAMDAWTNDYGRPWSVASYGGPLTLERKIAHTIRFNTANIIYSPYYSSLRLILEEYMLSFHDIASQYHDAKCPTYRKYVMEVLNMNKYDAHSNLVIYKYDWKLCHSILYGWMRRNVSELASFDGAAAIGEVFAWYHSPDYAPGDLPPEVEEMIEGWENDSGDYWSHFRYEGKRYADIQRDLTANLTKVNAGWLPDAPEAGVADYGTMLFLIATGRLLQPTPDEAGLRP